MGFIMLGTLSAGVRLAVRLFALCAAIALCGADAAYADGVDVRKAAVTPTEDGYVLEAVLDVRLTHVLDDALHKGVPLYFVLDFELIRARWYWTNEKVAVVQQQQRLSYNTLTRQYRIGVGALYQNFATLTEALDYMSRVRRRLDIEPGGLRKDTTYAAMLRLRLDGTQLPKPFQLHTGRNWDVSSDWYRWTVTP
jgi:hypothetical protein